MRGRRRGIPVATRNDPLARPEIGFELSGVFRARLRGKSRVEEKTKRGAAYENSAASFQV